MWIKRYARTKDGFYNHHLPAYVASQLENVTAEEDSKGSHMTTRYSS